MLRKGTYISHAMGAVLLCSESPRNTFITWIMERPLSSTPDFPFLMLKGQGKAPSQLANVGGYMMSTNGSSDSVSEYVSDLR